MKTKTVFDLTIDFEKSHGSYVFNKNTQTDFLDFFSMFSSLPLGYNHRIFDDSFTKKISAISKIRMANNFFQTDELVEFRDKFRKYVFSDYIHFNCTGALAVESALKCAMKSKALLKIKTYIILSPSLLNPYNVRQAIFILILRICLLCSDCVINTTSVLSLMKFRLDSA